VTYDKPMSEISSMSTKYWGLQTGTLIYASDGIITVIGYNTGTFEVLHTIITYTDDSTSSIVNDDGILTWEETKGGNSEWDENSTIKSVIIGTDTNNIDEHAFGCCYSLTSITIPNSVTSISDWTFYECSSLLSIEIPETVESIGRYAFNGCTSLSSVTIPNSVTSIADAFWNCTALSSIEIPNSVTMLGHETFGFCSSLTSVYFNKPISEISSMAYKYWRLNVGTLIYASDGIITVTGTNTGTSKGYPTVITYTDDSTSSIVNDDGVLTQEEIKGEGNQWNANTTIKSVEIGTDTSSLDSNVFLSCTSLS
jgi:hypothetical protein